MKQTTFDTTQKAQELMQRAMEIWQRTEHSEYLEGLEKDPVFQMLMNALAYQSNEIDAKIEQIRTDVVEEFEHLLSLDCTASAVPATISVGVEIADDADSVVIDSGKRFKVTNKDVSYPLMPLLRTLAINADVRRTVRLDQRRWMVTLSVGMPVHSLQGWSFAIEGVDYHNLSVSLVDYGGSDTQLDIIAPEELSELPMCREFSFETLVYNRSHAQVAGRGRHGALSAWMNWCAMDLFARQNIRMYFVNWDDRGAVVRDDRDELSFIFEFDGVRDDFVFDKHNLQINTNILINAQTRGIDISSDCPVVRLAGMNTGDSGEQFLHLVRPAEEQMYGSLPLQIRTVAADRFNHAKLMLLISNMLNKYYTDFYAFMALGIRSEKSLLNNLNIILTDLQQKLSGGNETISPGTYVMIDGQHYAQLTHKVSLHLDYVITQGAMPNNILLQAVEIQSEDESLKTRIVAPAVLGADAVRNKDAENIQTRYLMITGDRLVTQMDIKLFCQMELLVRYNIVREMIKSIRLKRELLDMGSFHSYRMVVCIVLASNKFIHRTFADQIPSVEIYMQKMIEVRSVNAVPVCVKIEIEKQ